MIDQFHKKYYIHSEQRLQVILYFEKKRKKMIQLFLNVDIFQPLYHISAPWQIWLHTFGNGTHTQHNNDVMAWKRFPHYRQFVRGIHRPSVDSPPATSGFPTHGQTNLWCFVCRWTNSGVLSRHDAQACEAIVMPFNFMLLGLRNLNSEDQLHQWFCCNSNSIEVPFLFQANSNKFRLTGPLWVPDFIPQGPVMRVVSFLCDQSAEQRVNFLVIWDAVTLKWRHSLKQKKSHFDEILVAGYTEQC